MRIIKSFGIVIGGYLLAILGSVLVVFSGADSTGESGSGVALIVFAAYWGLLATKVGYRWFDFFFAALPFYGIFWMFKIAHRIARLPLRDWAEKSNNES